MGDAQGASFMVLQEIERRNRDLPKVLKTPEICEDIEEQFKKTIEGNEELPERTKGLILSSSSSLQIVPMSLQILQGAAALLKPILHSTLLPKILVLKSQSSKVIPCLHLSSCPPAPNSIPFSLT